MKADLRPWLTLLLMMASLGVWASPASAHPRPTLVGSGLTCVEAHCDSVDDCTARYGRTDYACNNDHCVRDVDDEDLLKCCEATNCPDRYRPGGSQAQKRCTTVSGTSFAVCTYEGLFDYCADSDDVSLEQVTRCLTTLSGGAATWWGEGDCDGDGIANVEDSEICGSAIARDAGPPEDAGRAPMDAGAPGSDPRDGSGDPLGGYSLRGRGGCACGPTVGPNPKGGAAFLIIGLLFLVALGRRR